MGASANGQVGGVSMLRALWFDPRAFNFLIMTLYACSALRWACAGKWCDAAYWVSALSITAVVTFGYRH